MVLHIYGPGNQFSNPGKSKLPKSTRNGCFGEKNDKIQCVPLNSIEKLCIFGKIPLKNCFLSYVYAQVVKSNKTSLLGVIYGLRLTNAFMILFD